ncbi:hypothetical protein P0E62_13930, partial [Enterococcus faecalis]|uniref:hypothetical protein n=1 Tax=Enterococcus faecalis TaxID=1351 RepID=UPI0025AEDDAE
MHSGARAHRPHRAPLGYRAPPSYPDSSPCTYSNEQVSFDLRENRGADRVHKIPVDGASGPANVEL